MESNYVIWEYEHVENSCSLDELRGVEKIFELNDGVSQASTFPEDAAFTMHPDRVHDTLLVDSVFNTHGLIVASRPLKEFLESRALKKVEYLPVAILDHKGKPTSNDYFIIHPIEPVDCLNIDKCGAIWSDIVEDEIDEVDTLVIDESKVGATRELFRPKYFNRVILARRDLADALDREGFTGICWMDLSRQSKLRSSEG